MLGNSEGCGRDCVFMNGIGRLADEATPEAAQHETTANRMALGYRWEDEQWKLEPALADGAFGVTGGMLTSISDLSKYVGALLAAWPPRRSGGRR